LLVLIHSGFDKVCPCLAAPATTGNIHIIRFFHDEFTQKISWLIKSSKRVCNLNFLIYITSFITAFNQNTFSRVLNKVWVASVALMISLSIVGLSSEFAFAGSSVIDLSKSVNKPIIISGTEVTYTYNFENTGLQTLLKCSLTDSELGPIPIDAASVRLSPGETGTADKSTNIFTTTTNDATLSCKLVK